MLFRAKIMDPKTGAHNRASIQLDPWEEELGKRGDSLFFGNVPVGEWIAGAWPAFAYNDPTLEAEGTDHDLTIFRRLIDRQREERWEKGERFQVDSFT